MVAIAYRYCHHAYFPLKTTNATASHILLSGNQPIHINQVIEIDSNRSPKRLINAFLVSIVRRQWVTIEGVYKCGQSDRGDFALKKLMTIPCCMYLTSIMPSMRTTMKKITAT
ncbi:MAG: hypothetical protein U1E91_05790 [Moraxella sp.]